MTNLQKDTRRPWVNRQPLNMWRDSAPHHQVQAGEATYVGQALVRPLSRAVACSSTSQWPAWMTNPCATHTCSARNLFRVDSSLRTGACPTATLTVGQKERMAQGRTAQASWGCPAPGAGSIQSQRRLPRGRAERTWLGGPDPRLRNRREPWARLTRPEVELGLAAAPILCCRGLGRQGMYAGVASSESGRAWGKMTFSPMRRILAALSGAARSLTHRPVSHVHSLPLASFAPICSA